MLFRSMNIVEKMQAAQEEIHRRETELRSFTDAVNKGVLITEYDTNLKLIYISQKFLDLIGLKREQIEGASFSDFVSDTHDLSGNLLADMWTALSLGEDRNTSVRALLPNGETIILNAFFTPIKDLHGEIYKYLGMCMEQNAQKEIGA